MPNPAAKPAIARRTAVQSAEGRVVALARGASRLIRVFGPFFILHTHATALRLSGAKKRLEAEVFQAFFSYRVSCICWKPAVARMVRFERCSYDESCDYIYP